MFVLTTLVYPVVLALLCLGAGLLVDRVSGGVLPRTLLATVGAATLIAVSQLSTYLAPVAPATPYLLAAMAAAGFACGWGRARAFVRAWRASRLQLLITPIAYALALAPVLLAGRPTFSSYMALADSAVHMMGADFLLRHGQDYSHLDLRNSYGAFVHAYYGSSYPSGADTLLGGSALLLRLPLIWAFQPFTAFALAIASGPAWVLVRRVGLDGAWGALATLTVTLPALVYAYELIGSVKEIVALGFILSMGALVVEHRRWLSTGPRGAIPFALLAAAGVSALGAGFGAWVLATAVVLAAVAIVGLGGHAGPDIAAVAIVQSGGSAGAGGSGGPVVRGGSVGSGEHGEAASARARSARAVPDARWLGSTLAAGVLVLAVAALPTWVDLSGSLRVAHAIATASNPGNLHSPLRPTQLAGIWLDGSYKLPPSGVLLTLTSILVALVLALALAGMGSLVRTGRYTLAAWLASMVLLWLALYAYATTWADAKALMLTSPAVVLMAWSGFVALRSSPVRLAAPLVAFVLVGGVLASDALQYHASNLAPTARLQELASIDTRFSGRGPTLFGDFDEYALYELRHMDVGGPDFAYPPPALAGAAGGYGRPVALDRIAPAALAAYPLLVTRRDPLAARPPAAYWLLWQGVYYEVWARSPGAPPALAHVALSGAPGSHSRCSQLAGVAAFARSYRAGSAAARSGNHSLAAAARGGARLSAVPGAGGVRLVAALAPELVTVPLAGVHRPAGWGLVRSGIEMGRPGTLRASFRLPRGGAWELWLKGDVMRALRVAIDGRPLGSIGGQLGGNSLVLNTLTPLLARLTAGSHTLAIARPGATLAPGDGGAALLAGIFLTPAGPLGRPPLQTVSSRRPRSLCRWRSQWIEVVPEG
jgi:hypothetical protein